MSNTGENIVVSGGHGIYSSNEPTIMILDIAYEEIKEEDTKGDWFILDRMMVKAVKRPNWFHRKMLKLIFGIKYVIGTKE